MAMKLPALPTQGPMRVPAGTTGRLAIAVFRIVANPAGERVSPAMSGTTPERSRILPSASTMPGFSRPAGPKRTSFIGVSLDVTGFHRGSAKGGTGYCVGRASEATGAHTLHSTEDGSG